MKYLLSIVLITATAATAFSTGQITEKINDNGVSKGLTSRLLELDSISFPILKERIPKEMISTGLRRNYIGYWKIKNDSLFLDSILVRDKTCDTLRFAPAKIDDIYASRHTPSGYFADWVTDTFRIVSGNIVYYKHMDWNSYWQNEEFVSVKEGVITARTIYENHAVNNICEDETMLRKIIDSLNLGFIPKRIVLQLGYQGFDGNGVPTGYKIKVLRSCGDTNVDNMVARAFEDSTVMRSLIPIYYIRGQYRSEERILSVQ